jgi:hypothetical protein
MTSFINLLNTHTETLAPFERVREDKGGLHILARGLHVVLMPGFLVAGILDILIGATSGTLTLMTLGSWKWAAKSTSKREIGRYVLPLIYSNFAGFLKPGEIQKIHDKLPSDAIRFEGNGLISDRVINWVDPQATELTASESIFKKHVASRLTYVALAVCCVVARLFDAVLSVPMTAISLITFGRFDFFNIAALRTLQAPAVINDLFYCAVKTLNPWSEVEISSSKVEI